MNNLNEFREFFRQKYAHLGLPDTDEGLVIAARLWLTEEQQNDAAAAENMSKMMALLDAKETELELCQVIKRKSRGEFTPGNAHNNSAIYDSDLYLPILDRFIAKGLSAELAYLQTAEQYVEQHDPAANVLKVSAAIKKKVQRAQEKQK